MAPVQFYIDQWTSLPPNLTGPQLAGKIVIVTGATSGIGLEAAHQLAALKPEKLILTARSTASGATAVQAVLARAPAGTNVDCWELDLEKYATVKAFAERAGRELPRVDILMSNAATSPGFHHAPLSRTEDGHESTVQTNVYAQILMLLLLYPSLEKSPTPRVVFTSSEVAGWAPTGTVLDGYRKGSILKAFDDAGAYVNGSRYFESKLLLQMIIRHLLPALPAITILATNPGLCRSNLGRNIKFPRNLSGLGTMLWFVTTARSAAAGARTIVWSAVEAEESCEYSTQCRAHFPEIALLATNTGKKAAKLYYDEVLAEMERVAPGCTKVLERA